MAKKKVKKNVLSVVVGTTAMVGLSASSAFAGELTGNGKSLHPLNANSICAYSGLDDADDDEFGKTQNWGQLPKEVRDVIGEFGAHPGEACNGHLNPYQGGGH